MEQNEEQIRDLNLKAFDLGQAGGGMQLIIADKQVNENELAYRLVEKLTIPFELDTLYQNFDKTPQPILKNKNSIKTYSPAIYRVNGTNSKKNKSSNVLYGKERAVRYLRKE